MVGLIILLVCLANFKRSKAARAMLIVMCSVLATVCFMLYVQESLAVLLLFPVVLVIALTILHNKYIAPWCRG